MKSQEFLETTTKGPVKALHCGTLIDGEELVLADLQLPAAGTLDGSPRRTKIGSGQHRVEKWARWLPARCWSTEKS